MSFQKRMSAARAHEELVMNELSRRGWVAEPFGQGQLSERMRGALREVDTPVRWMADIIAAKPYPARMVIRFIDAKAGDRWRETGNHDIEQAALDSAENWVEFSGKQCEFFYVFGDLGVISPMDARELVKPGQFRGSGSGTPFVLLPAAACVPFDAVFGQPAR